MIQRKRLGEMLLEAKVLSEEQLQEAIANHRKAGMKLGQYLVHANIVKESQVIDTISAQLNIEKYSPARHAMDTDLSGVITSEMAKKYQVVPIKKQGQLLTVATTDPMDIDALDFIEMYTETEVEPVICSEKELNYLIGSIYGTYSGLDDLLGSMDAIDFNKEEEKEKRPVADVQVTSLHDMAEEAPIIRLVNSILAQAVREGASDVHISPEKDYVQMRFRVDGKLHEVPAPPKSMVMPIISRLKILANLDIAVTRVPQDGRFTVNMGEKEINIRVSTLPTIYGENMVLRLLDMSTNVYSLDQLGMSKADRDKIESVIHRPYGMILSTGPTGSGKSTSLYSILKVINTPDINIITLEDPVEYRMGKVRQAQLNRKAGMTFASGLRSILRQDPDVIMVGEIRDGETANIAVQSALTGHRVLSTVHTNDAAGAITRFIDMGVEPFLISSVLLCSFAQRLIRKVCDNCKEPYVPSEKELVFWGLKPEPNTRFMKGRGCMSCRDTGYRGRTGIFEVLLIDEQVQEMIVENRTSHEITRAVHERGLLRTLKEDAADKVRRGITTLEEASAAVMV
jgi:type IV pilus assembly protein PilB